MDKKQDSRTYKIKTARIAEARLVSVKPTGGTPRRIPVENAREIVLKLIEAIKRL